jgi:outer membrane protein OmpA-like peptidoglycan-associated protein
MEHNNPKTGKPRADRNKYFIKVGISVVDLGRLKYVKDYNSSDLVTSFTPDYINRYNSSDNSVPVNTHWLNAGSVDFTFRKYVPFADTMYRRYSSGQDLGVVRAKDNKEEFKVSLPTAFSIQADVYLIEGVYVNLTTYTALNQGYSKPAHNHYLTTVSVTPRYEQKWYGFALPIQVDQYGHFEAGLGVRAGIVYFGVSNLFSTVFEDPYGMKGYVGVKIPVPHKDPNKTPRVKKTKGGDDAKIIVCCPCCGCEHDSMDCEKCKVDCPEISKTHVDPVHQENSINITNSTIIIDNSVRTDSQINKTIEIKEQESDSTGRPCPPPPSMLHFDNNKSIINDTSRVILDYFAECLIKDPSSVVLITGHTDSIGTDSANMKLSYDRANSVKNYFVIRGVNPKQINLKWHGERMPIAPNSTNAGRAMNRRVLLEITTDPGTIVTRPIKTQKELPQDTVEHQPAIPIPIPNSIPTEQPTYIDYVLFKSGQAIIDQKYYPELDKIAKFLESNPLKSIRIEGFSDNIGGASDNMKLSKFRANVVARYLISRGANADQITIDWYGESNPPYDNSTQEGQAQNRRVNIIMI